MTSAEHMKFAGYRQNIVRGRCARSRCFAGLAVLTLAAAATSRAAPQTGDETARIGTWIQDGRLDIAETALQRILAREPLNDEAGRMLGAVYLREERFAEAESILRKAADIPAASAETHRLLGDALLAQGKTSAAEGQYSDSLRMSPAEPHASLALARLYVEDNRFAEALRLAQAVPPSRRSIEFLPVLAECHLALEQPQAADAEIRAILAHAAENPSLVPQVAEFFLDHGSASDAALLLKAAASQEHTPQFMLDEARVQGALGNHKEAGAMLARLMETKPDYPGAFEQAGRMAARDGDWQRAIYLFERAQKLAPPRPQLLRDLAAAQLHAYKPQDALASAERLQGIAPDESYTWYYLALAYAGLHQDEKARAFAERVVAVHPEDREMNLTLANSAILAHAWAAARKYVQVCLERNPADPGALYYLGVVQRDEGNVAAAIASLKESVAGNPNNEDTQELLGALCLQSGDLSCAHTAFEAAVRLAPKRAHNHYQLALACQRLRLKEEARKEMELYNQLNVNPQDSPATVQPAGPPLAQP